MDDLTAICGDVSRETYERLRAFGALAEKWSRRINLVSSATRSQIWQRHILDSAQLLPLIRQPVSHYVDIGSGGGFPAIVLAILLRDAGAADRITLVESDARKSVFLRQASRDLDLRVQVLTDRIETLDPLEADLLTARALAPLSDLMKFASLHLKSGGVALFPKGRRAQDEIADLRDQTRFVIEGHSSRTDPEATILEVKDI